MQHHDAARFRQRHQIDHGFDHRGQSSLGANDQLRQIEIGSRVAFGLPLTHLAIAFAIAHPGVTSAIIGPRTMEQLDDLLAGVDVRLTDEILDQIDEIVPPGTDVGAPDTSAYLPPALLRPSLRRRPAGERAAVA